MSFVHRRRMLNEEGLLSSETARSGFASDTVFPGRGRLVPPSDIRSYEAFAKWFASFGGDLFASKKRHTAKREKNHVPRPPNPFIIFRSWAALAANSQLISDQSMFSKDAGARWNSLTEQEREEWERVSKFVKEHHKKVYPGYVFHPKRPGCNQETKASASSAATLKRSRSNQKVAKEKPDRAAKELLRTPETRPRRPALHESPYYYESTSESDPESEAESPPLSPSASTTESDDSVPSGLHVGDIRSSSSQIKVYIITHMSATSPHAYSLRLLRRSRSSSTQTMSWSIPLLVMG
jgi:hypothetical protein